MKIGILGSGMVGQALALGLKKAGHDVRLGSRDGKKLDAFAKEHGFTQGTFADVAAFGEAVVFCMKGEVAEGVAKEFAKVLAGKLVLDTTNPIAGPPNNGVIPYFTAAGDSLIQRIQKAAPEAKVVKWMNSVGSHFMANPKFKGGTPSMFICGDDAGAKATTTKLSADLGWNTEDVGGAGMGGPLEALCQIWCAPGFLRNDWAHGFAMLRP
ncbi:MAG: NAD(P)-binding domain-containing protein [Myxococcaceae bacterium]